MYELTSGCSPTLSPFDDHIATVAEMVLRTLRTHSAENVSTSLSEKSPLRTRVKKLTTSAGEGLSRWTDGWSAQCRSHWYQPLSWLDEVEPAQLCVMISSIASSFSPWAAKFARKADFRASARTSNDEVDGGEESMGGGVVDSARAVDATVESW